MTPQVRLFSYGTLQQPEVQRATFGRLLEGRPDRLPGFRLETVVIVDAGVVETSGSAVHLIAVAAEAPDAEIPGVVFEITPEELAAADGYETADYARIKARLASGLAAWVYVRPT